MSTTRSSSLWLFALAAAVVVGLVALGVYNKRAPSSADGLAQCLASQNVKMYGTYWCPNCTKQRKLFGNAFRFINYKECSPANQRSFALCANDNITGVPTWEFADGSRLQGVQDLQTLADKTNCSLASPSDTPLASSNEETPKSVQVEINGGDTGGVQVKDITVE